MFTSALPSHGQKLPSLQTVPSNSTKKRISFAVFLSDYMVDVWIPHKGQLSPQLKQHLVETETCKVGAKCCRTI